MCYRFWLVGDVIREISVYMVSIRTRPWSFPLALALAHTLASAAVPAAELGQERIVDLEIVLAVDASSSVSDEEFDLQIRGLAEAFRHRSVTRAIRATGDLGLAVALFQWADNQQQILASDWMLVRDEPTAFTRRGRREAMAAYRSTRAKIRSRSGAFVETVSPTPV